MSFCATPARVFPREPNLWRLAGLAVPDETVCSATETIFHSLRRALETNIGYRCPVIKQRSSIMLAFVLSLFYQHSCKKYLAAVRKYRELSDRWT